ncbi:unnamed protein product [Fusarium graminearum]|nr:unnamed protein product [Fusarium graminearum]
MLVASKQPTPIAIDQGPHARTRLCTVFSQTPANKRKSEQQVTENSDVEFATTTFLPPYTTFGRKQSILILCLASYAASFSTLSSFIVFPVIDDISEGLNVSVLRVNLSITSYMIVAGLAPAILGDLTDKVGRRIVYIFMMTIYCTANIGLALQSNWSALFVLRMAQSVGSAATIALGYGVVSDIAPPSERGSFVSIMVLGSGFTGTQTLDEQWPGRESGIFQSTKAVQMVGVINSLIFNLESGSGELPACVVLLPTTT